MALDASCDHILQRTACTLDTANPVVGSVPLSWSEDNCIAVATSDNVITYDLNPLKNAGCPNMLFKVQVIPCPARMCYNGSVKEILENYDLARAITQRGAAPPDIEIYRTHLNSCLSQIDAPDMKNNGVNVVLFSPLYCAEGDGSVLGILTISHRLQLLIKHSNGTLIQWTKALDLTDVLVKILGKNHGYYPNTKFPKSNSSLQSAWEKQYAASINNFAWSSRKCSRNGEKLVYVATSTKNNYIQIWKLGLPICATSVVSILSYIEVYDEGEIKSLTFAPVESSGFSVVVGNVDGRVLCLQLDKDGSIIKKSNIWPEKDELAVSSINWQQCSKNRDCSNVLLAKGSFVVHVKLASDFKMLSYSVLKDVHSTPVMNIACWDKAKWLSTSKDGIVAKIWLNCSGTGTDQLKSEILAEASGASTLFHEETHHLRISPNKALVAILRSKPKVSRSVMTKNSSFLEIRTLMSGIESFESLCRGQEDDADDFSRLDMLECVRQHLILQEFAPDNSVLQNSLRQFVTVAGEPSPLKWCLAKICAATFAMDAMYEEVFHRLEREITITRMIKVLEWWWASDSSSDSQNPPVNGIVRFLHANTKLLSRQHQKFIDNLEKSAKYRRAGNEVCGITGETMTFSEDAKYAVTDESHVQWFRCCLTFCPVQGHKHRKCEASNARALPADSKMHDLLLHGRSIYSGLPMI